MLKVRLAVEPSKFCLDYHRVLENNAAKLRKFDKEPQAFKQSLHEFPVEFPPT